MKKSHLVAVVLVVSGVTAFVATRVVGTDRQRVARVVSELTSRFEERDVAGLCALLAEDYRDGHGLDRAAVRASLRRLVGGFGAVSAEATQREIRMPEGPEESALVTFQVDVEAHRRGRTQRFPWRYASPMRLRLRKREGAWLVCEAEYQLPRGVRAAVRQEGVAP